MVCVKRIQHIQTKDFIFTQDKIIYNATVADNDVCRGVLLNEFTEKHNKFRFPLPHRKRYGSLRSLIREAYLSCIFFTTRYNTDTLICLVPYCDGMGLY